MPLLAQGTRIGSAGVGSLASFVLDRVSVSANFNAAYGSGWTSQVTANYASLSQDGSLDAASGITLPGLGIDASLTVNVDVLRLGPPVNAPVQSMTSACLFAGAGGCANFGFVGNSVMTFSISVGVGIGAGVFNSVVMTGPIRVF
jgi:hypothetical protein